MAGFNFLRFACLKTRVVLDHFFGKFFQSLPTASKEEAQYKGTVHQQEPIENSMVATYLGQSEK